MPTLRFDRVVHLSHVIDESMPVWPGDPPVTLTPAADLAKEGYFLRRLAIGEHGGTHVNAPATFFAGAAPLHDWPAEHLIRPAVVINVRESSARDSDYLLTVDDIEAWEDRHGRVPTGSVVLVRTGWDSKWPDPRAFLGTSPSGMHFPGVGLAAARRLLEERGASGVGIDTHGIDGGRDDRFSVNRFVLGRGGIVLECLANLDQVPAVGATLVVGILRLRDGSGSPSCVLALV